MAHFYIMSTKAGTKYVFVSGGVISGVGKGVAAVADQQLFRRLPKFLVQFNPLPVQWLAA